MAFTTANPPASPNLPAPDTSLDDPSLYINRELSWLQFNRRVLDEARDPTVPFLERLKFLAIFSSNLDEFFMVRVGGLRHKVQAGIMRGSGADRDPPRKQLDRINETVREMVTEQYRCLREEVLPSLEREGIIIKSAKELSADDKKHLRDVFQREVFPVLTPLAVDPGHPFPHLLNKSLNLAVLLKRPSDGDRLLAVVQAPSVLPRFIQLSSGKGHVFVPLEAVIRLHLDQLFPGMTIDEATCFRLTRDSEYEIDDDEVEDLLKTIEEHIKQRRRGDAVRLELEAAAPAEVEQFLIQACDVDPVDVHRIPGLLDLTGMFQIYGITGYPHLRDPLALPQPVADFNAAGAPWATIRAKDLLLHHPYESFSPVVDFIEQAAADDRVLAIKQTLYRTSSDSPIVRALQRAADRGKQVTALIELKARLDEERNILWAKELEKSGVHVVFGFVGLKTHCKVALVVRREEDGIRRYVHLSTGNYNPQTARLYTDLSFFTCNPDFCEDASALFNYLTGYCELPMWRKLVVAPSRLQSVMIERIEQEAANHRAGKGGRIIAKLNGVLEPAVIQALYRASQAGVPIDLICRGICALRPGIPGISQTIRVRSIVDRFLEHSRIYYFGNAGDPLVYLGSADWMDRNLSRRVEVVWPVEQPDLKARLIDEVLATTMADNVKAREMLPDGTYRRMSPEASTPLVRSQERFQKLAEEMALRRQIPGTATTAPAPAEAPPAAVPKPRRRQRHSS